MQLETIACNQCGAPLSVPEAAKFVRCNHCAASLAVRRNESVTYTEVVEKLVAHTSKLTEQVAHLRYQTELSRIERDWESERKKHLIKQKDGSLSEPTHGGAMLTGIASGIGGAIALFIGFTTKNIPFALFGLAAVAIGLVSAVAQSHKAKEFDRAKKRYYGRRGRLKVDDFLNEDAPAPLITDDIPPLR